MNEYEKINISKELNQVKFCNKLSNVFGVLLIFDLLRGFFMSDAFSYLNSLVWLGFFISCLIGKSLSTIRLDIHYKT